MAAQHIVGTPAGMPAGVVPLGPVALAPANPLSPGGPAVMMPSGEVFVNGVSVGSNFTMTQINDLRQQGSQMPMIVKFAAALGPGGGGR